jgi:signal transduction histidine kinase
LRLPRWRGLTLQLFVLTVLPLTLLLLAIAFGSLALHQRAMRSMIGERDERATRAAAAAISEQLKHRQSAIRGLALQAANAVGPEHALADAAFLLPDFEGGIALFSSGGVVLAASNGHEIWQARAAAARLIPFQQPGSLENAEFLSPSFDPASEEELMLVASSAGEFIAVGAFSPANLARRALAGIFGASELATAYVVTADGAIQYQTGTPPWSESPPQQHPGVADALRGESGATYLTVAGTEHVVAFSPIAPVGWALVIQEPWRAVADPLLRTTELAPLILIPVLVIALVALWFGVRQVVQPLQSLERQATALGWGDFGAIEVPVGGISEIQRLQAELIHMAQKVSMAQKSLRGYLGAVTTGQEEERRRLARDLHDDTIQALIALNQQIQLAQLSVSKETTATKLATMQQMAEQMIGDLRRLTRNLRPIYLEDLGLVAALEVLSHDMNQLLQIPVTFETSGKERRLGAREELALYRIAQEGLNNVTRHAQASQAGVCLAFESGAIRLAIRDNGVGFVAPESPAQMAATGHYGLLGVQERAELIGAHMVIESTPGSGTEIIIKLPAG